MIKINLLPKTLSQKAAMRNVVVLFAVALLVLIVAGVGYSFKLQRDVSDMEEQAAAAKQLQQQVQSIKDQTTQLRASVQQDQQKLQFIKDVLNYNLEFPKRYDEISQWTYEKAVLTGLECDGTSVILRARVNSLDDLGRYLLNMYQATGLFTSVQITGATGFKDQAEGGPQAGPVTPGRQIPGSQASLAGIQAITTGVSRTPTEQKGIDFTVVCTLKRPIVAPTPPNPGAGAPGAPGSPPGTGAPPTPGAPGAPPPGPPGGGPASNAYPPGTPDLERQMGGAQ